MSTPPLAPKTLSDLTFEDWLAHCFDHETSWPQWFDEPHAPEWYGSAALTISHLTRMFDAPDLALSAYSDEQVNQGLWYIVSNVYGNYMFALVDVSVSLTERIACIASIESLYTKCFAARCSEQLSHGMHPGDDVSPLNAVCYMFWDLMPLMPEPKDPQRDALDKAVLHVLEAVLRSPSIACQESALHGLGHWELGYPNEVYAIIARYLEHAQPSEALRAYAEQAAVGNVQ